MIAVQLNRLLTISPPPLEVDAKRRLEEVEIELSTVKDDAGRRCEEGRAALMVVLNSLESAKAQCKARLNSWFLKENAALTQEFRKLLESISGGERQVNAMHAEGGRGVSVGAGELNDLEGGIQGLLKGLTPRVLDLEPMERGIEEVGRRIKSLQAAASSMAENQGTIPASHLNSKDNSGGGGGGWVPRVSGGETGLARRGGAGNYHHRRAHVSEVVPPGENRARRGLHAPQVPRLDLRQKDRHGVDVRERLPATMRDNVRQVSDAPRASRRGLGRPIGAAGKDLLERMVHGGNTAR